MPSAGFLPFLRPRRRNHPINSAAFPHQRRSASATMECRSARPPGQARRLAAVDHFPFRPRFPVSTKLKPVAVLLFLGACAFGGGSAVVVLGPLLTAAASAQGGAGHGGADLLRTSERFEAVARKVMPAVVAVEAKKPAGAKRP